MWTKRNREYKMKRGLQTTPSFGGRLKNYSVANKKKER